MQAVNPYLPSWEYIPDAEPRVFGDRVYIYGSHDRFNAPMFCVNDYVCWSAPVNDLSAWRCSGVIYRRNQDSMNRLGLHLLFAPDVVRGTDGRYYLYYAYDFLGVMGVAVCDTPDGTFTFYGHIHDAQGRLWGRRRGDEFPFAPGVLVDDDGRVYLYSGFATRVPAVMSGFRQLKNSGGVVVELEKDMVTMKREPKLLFPRKGSREPGAFEGHEFFEASSIRKIDGQYVFVYSSSHNHELCYAVSDRPDGGFRYGGTLVDQGDLYLDGREDEQRAANYLGNTHGGMVELNGRWYIFYHRQTNQHSYSRQACAEPLERTPEGGFRQAEVTSCGLNGGSLVGRGTYPARIACNLWSGEGTRRYDRRFNKRHHPYFTQNGRDGDEDAVQYIANMRDGSVAGFKYFDCDAVNRIAVRVSGRGEGEFISLFGMHTINLVSSTSGSAGGSTDANGIEESTLQMAMENAGFYVNPKLIDLYTRHQTLGTTSNELPVSYYSDATISTYNGYHDAAVIVFSRTGSEAADKKASNVEGHADPTDHELMLDDNEKALVKHVKTYYPNAPIIVLINSSNILQIPELAEPKATSEYGVDAIFWGGNTGNNAIEAIGQLISGEVNPSGHTVEVWEKDFTQGPTWTNFAQQSQNLDENGQPMDAYYYYEGEPTKYATVEYREGIYVGYKYYETLYDDAAEADKEATYSNVLYPFGYGLSYTSFDWELVSSDVNTITDAWQKMSMSVKVTNTGSVAGKDVVQVYANPPYTQGGIEKDSANLVGFAKTDLLQPGESEVVTIEWVAQDMASFDWNDANANGFIGYELEGGSYEITARRSSHDVVLAETYTIGNGILCTKDYTSGNEITALFVDDSISVNDSLLSGMISRANGLKQPEPSSVADRTIDADYLALIDNQYTYRSYMDQGYESWFVDEGGIPDTWTQVAERHEDDVEPISILDMTGVDFTLSIQDGQVVQGDDEGSKKWEAFMNQLTWEEMAQLVNNGGGVQAIPAVGVARTGASETPLQLAGGTMWACPPILAATFNLELAERVGVMMGNEALFKNCSYWQGNAMNIHRSPLSGRNVEYYSQDGVHGGLFAAAVAKGVTSKGVTCHIKHMMLNDQESYRDLNGGVFTWATEQVIRELYAKPFEYALKSGNSTGVMGSFNRIGNINSQLNSAVKSLVRDEWANRAIFETDAWQGTYCSIDLMVRQGDN